MLTAPADKIKAVVKQATPAGIPADAEKQMRDAVNEVTKTVNLIQELRDHHKSKLSRAAKVLVAQETTAAPSITSTSTGVVKTESTLLTKVHDQLSKILANKDSG